MLTNLHLLIKSSKGFPGAQMVKNPLCNAGNPSLIPGLGRSPEKEMANHSSILAWRILWTEKPGGLQSMGSQRVGHKWATNTDWLTDPTLYIYLLEILKLHFLEIPHNSDTELFLSDLFPTTDFQFREISKCFKVKLLQFHFKLQQAYL